MAALLPGFFPAAAQNVAPPSPHGSALREDEAFFWYQMHALLEEIEQALAQGSGAAVQTVAEATEADVLAHASSTADRFRAYGLRAGLSDAEISDALDAVASLRARIVSSPDLCVDPYWDTFLPTLADIENALRDAPLAERAE